jgi:hypothetical protein
LLYNHKVSGEPLIKDNFPLNDTMIATTKTTALIAAISLLGAAAPAAFAQTYFNNYGDVKSSLDVKIDKKVDQNIYQSAYTGDYSKGDIDQEASQGFCEQIGVSQATAGNVANSAVDQEISSESKDNDFNKKVETTTDCS